MVTLGLVFIVSPLSCLFSDFAPAEHAISKKKAATAIMSFLVFILIKQVTKKKVTAESDKVTVRLKLIDTNY